jgi:hypothetical protein
MGRGLTAKKECRWLKPVLVGQFEFVEWTADGRYMGLLDDTKPGDAKLRTRKRRSVIIMEDE